MRIISGRFRNRRLAAAPGLTTRPLTDRAKVKLFERLEPFDGMKVLDVFAGTGTMGLEALSRGAATAVFVERDHKAHALLRGNVAAVGIAEDVLCWRADVTRCSFRPKGRDDLTPYDRVFFDPPYPLADQLRPGGALFKALARAGKAGVAAADCELILRVPTRGEPVVPDCWRPEREFASGGMTFLMFRRAEGATDADDDEPVNDDEPA